MKADELQREINLIEIQNETVIAEYYANQQLYNSISNDINVLVMQPEYVLPFLQPGRVIQFKHINEPIATETTTNIVNTNNEIIWAVVVNIHKNEKKTTEINYNVDILIELTSDDPNPNPILKMGEIISIKLSQLNQISAARLNLVKDLTKQSSKSQVLKSLVEVKRRYDVDKVSVPMLDPIKDFGITNEAYNELSIRLNELQTRIQSSTINTFSNKIELLEKFDIKFKLQEECKQYRLKAKESHALALKETMKRMTRVLKRLQYVNELNILSPKGRFACELSTGDELVLTDLIFDGIFNELTSEQCVGLLSCFVHKEGQTDDSTKIRNDLTASIRSLQLTARNISKVCMISITYIQYDFILIDVCRFVTKQRFQWTRKNM